MAGESDYTLLFSLANRVRVKNTFSYLSREGIDVILIKGWAVARFYDNELDRIYTDLDLAVFPGRRLPDRISFAGVIPGLAVDFHYGLGHLDKLKWEGLYRSSQLIFLDGIPIRVLADEDNLRVTAVHWLTDGGVNKERLWDIYYLVKNRKVDFDWERCLESNGPVRKTWVMAAIATARDHLDLDVSGLPEEAQQFQLPEWYKKTLEKEWERGPYVRRVMSSVITRPKLLFEQIKRRFPPNRIAATIDTETPIDDSSRLPAQIKSLTNKIGPFARGIGRRLTYQRQKYDR